MGSQQKNWFYRQLINSQNRGATWRVIGNQIVFSRVNVSDLVWLDEHDYDPSTGEGAVGAEFAGTAVTSSGFGGTIMTANNQSSSLVRDNQELQWNEGYYRGYFELHLSKDYANASYYGMPTVATRNPLEISIGNFSVAAGANRITRPVASGVVESGYIQTGDVVNTSWTCNTMNGTWAVRDDLNQMFIEYPKTSS